jgi:GT2 family glycosyltransferase
MDVSIIIVNYNTKELLRDSIISIMKNTLNINYEIIVVDNNSSDGSVQMVENEFPSVVLIASEKNGGFAYANNLGVAKAKGKYIFLLNSDTIILNDAISKMFNFMEENKEIGILGPKLLNADLTDQTSVFGFPTIFKEVASIFEFKKLLKNKIIKKVVLAMSKIVLPSDVGQYMRNYDKDRKPEVVQVLVGAAMLIREEVIDAIGGLDENYFMYYEEIDYCLQAYKQGWKCVFYPYAEIIHLIGQSSKKVSEFSFITRYVSMLKYFRKNHGESKENIVRTILILGLKYRILRDYILFKFERNKDYIDVSKIYRNTIKAIKG